MIKINEIKIFGPTEPLFKESSSLLFSWEDNNSPIVIFYYNNGYGKTTLFNLVKDIFQGISLTDAYIGYLQMKITIFDIVYLVTNSHSGITILKNGKDTITWAEWSNNIAKNILNKNENLLVTWKNISGFQQRNTLDSLLRFNFFTDDEYRKDNKNTNRCTLINSDLDGETKGILLDYILGENFDEAKINLFKIAYKYGAKQKIEKSTRNIQDIYPSYFEEDTQFSIFGNPELEFDSAMGEKIECKDRLLQIIAIEEKLIKLNEESKSIINNSLIEELINNELKEIKNLKKDYTYKYENISKRVLDLKDNFGDLLNQINTESKKSIQDRKEALKFISEHRDIVESYFNGDHHKFDKYLNEFLYKIIDGVFKKENIKFDFRNLKLELLLGDEKRGDGRLKTLRFLALIGIILFKAKYPSCARNLGIGFFDAPFYGVDMINSVNAINSISKFIKDNNIDTQIFLFVTKDEKQFKEDSFEEDLKKNNSIYFHPNFTHKEYLIS